MVANDGGGNSRLSLMTTQQIIDDGDWGLQFVDNGDSWGGGLQAVVTVTVGNYDGGHRYDWQSL